MMQYGKDEEYIVVKAIKTTKKHSELAKGAADSFFGKEEARRLRKDVRTMRVGQNQVCWYCEKDESRLPSGEKLRACIKCREIDRTILYCSKWAELFTFLMENF